MPRASRNRRYTQEQKIIVRKSIQSWTYRTLLDDIGKLELSTYCLLSKCLPVPHANLPLPACLYSDSWQPHSLPVYCETITLGPKFEASLTGTLTCWKNKYICLGYKEESRKSSERLMPTHSKKSTGLFLVAASMIRDVILPEIVFTLVTIWNSNIWLETVFRMKATLRCLS